VEVTSIRLFMFCTKLAKRVDFYDLTGVVVVSLLLIVEAGVTSAIRDTSLLEHTAHGVHFNRFAAK